jgi:hypothetical protein
MAGLKDLTGIARIKLPSGITDASLVHLAGVEKLEDLNLGSQPHIRGDGLRHLKDLPRLRRLHLHSTLVDDEGKKAVAELKQVAYLYLEKTK